MDALGAAVAWSAIIACGVSVVSVWIGRREARRAHREAQAREVAEAYERGRASMVDELTQCREERNYWRNEIVKRIDGH